MHTSMFAHNPELMREDLSAMDIGEIMVMVENLSEACNAAYRVARTWEQLDHEVYESLHDDMSLSLYRMIETVREHMKEEYNMTIITDLPHDIPF